VNPTTIMGTAAFPTLAMRNRKGWKLWPVAILMPICIVGFHTGVFAPLYITENAGWSADQSILSGLITTGFAVVLLMTFSRLLFSGSSDGQKG